MNEKNNVGTGKPKIGGAVWCAPLGTTLPTDAVSELDAAFKCLGYISEDGVKHEFKKDYDKIKAWGLDTVSVALKEWDDTIKFVLLEVLNTDVMKLVYGPDNVTGDLDSGVTVKMNGDPSEPCSIVIEKIINGVLARDVIPFTQVTAVAEVSYKDTDAVGYDTTMTNMPDAEGNAHYEYYKKK